MHVFPSLLMKGAVILGASQGGWGFFGFLTCELWLTRYSGGDGGDGEAGYRFPRVKT